MNKLDKYIVKQVALDFTTKESWLKVRKTKKDSKCENCGKLHQEQEGEIALATIEGRVNAHLCLACGERFIKAGAVDINKKKEVMKDVKTKLIKQAERVGIRFNTWYNKKKAEDHSVDELKKRIGDYIQSERSKFHDFLKTYNQNKETFDSLSEAFKASPHTIYADYWSFFADYDEELSRDEHRWIDYLTVRKTVNGKTFEYDWASCTGDNSIEDQGFEFDFAQVYEINKYDLITTTQVLDTVLDEIGVTDKEEYIDKIKHKILKFQ